MSPQEEITHSGLQQMLKYRLQAVSSHILMVQSNDGLMVKSVLLPVLSAWPCQPVCTH